MSPHSTMCGCAGSALYDSVPADSKYRRMSSATKAGITDALTMIATVTKSTASVVDVGTGGRPMTMMVMYMSARSKVTKLSGVLCTSW